MSNEKRGSSYADAGVDLEAGAEAVHRYRNSVAKTRVAGVMGGIGGFAGLFSLKDAGLSLDDPVLVSATDGVGTKLKLAFQLGIHHTIGQDCVAMCVNDIVATGARPLFFLDYLATGKLDPSQAADVVEGVAEACRASGCALLGGETAEMPGFYDPGEYDIAGFCVGIAERSELFDPARVVEGDVLIGLRSNGFHSNGYSLIRKIVADASLDLSDTPSANSATWGELLLRPTTLYTSAMSGIRGVVKAAAHITGGGFYENVPRALPPQLGAEITEPWTAPAFMLELCQHGEVSNREQHAVFNMGIGMVLVVAKADADATLAQLDDAVRLGHVSANAGVRIAGID